MRIIDFIKSKLIRKVAPSPAPIQPEPAKIAPETSEALSNAAAAVKEAEAAKAEAEAAVKAAEMAKLDEQIKLLKSKLPRRLDNSKDCIERYGGFKIIDGKAVWENEGKWCSSLIIPADIAEKWLNTATGKPTLKIYCNRDLQVPLMLALLLLKRKGLLSELKTFDGCYMIRKQRGGDTISFHSWAMAIDVNASENPLGAESVLSPEFVQCWKEAGFIWGGDWKRKDGQHFQYITNG